MSGPRTRIHLVSGVTLDCQLDLDRVMHRYDGNDSQHSDGEMFSIPVYPSCFTAWVAVKHVAAVQEVAE